MTPVAVPPGATTPQLIKQGMYASAACALLLLFAVTSGTRTHREALQTIGRDTAPSIIAAEHVSAALADMDASAVQELLNPSAHAFDKRRQEASEVLIAAAENMTGGDAERVPMRTLATGLSTYTAEVQHALDLRRAGDPAYLDVYREAASTLDQTLVPAAQLDRDEGALFDRTYAEQQKWSSAAMLFLVLGSMALIGVLIALQVFLTRRMRRVINPYLMIATALAFFSSFFFAESFTKADQELKVAKQDAFEYIHTLWRARAAAYNASAEQSRYLLDPARAAQYQQAFQQKADSIADGSLANYKALDGQIRTLEHSGQHAAAIRLSATGAQTELDKFDHTVGETLQVNQSAFDQAVKDGFDALDHVEMIAGVVTGAVALLAFLGLVPRLREYSV